MDTGIANEKVHVVPHVATRERAITTPVTEEEGLVLFFGRIWEYKGLKYLLKAEPLISARVPAARFLIAGEGEDFTRYEKLVVNRDRFEVHNRWISDDERAVMFQRAGMVVLPYIEATQSGVIPVASTYSKPVVATAVGSIPEVVEDGQTGLLVQPRDPNALARAIVALLRDKELRHRMGLRARAKIDAEASPGIAAEGHAEVYRQAIGDTQADRRDGC